MYSVYIPKIKWTKKCTQCTLKKTVSINSDVFQPSIKTLQKPREIWFFLPCYLINRNFPFLSVYIYTKVVHIQKERILTIS